MAVAVQTTCIHTPCSSSSCCAGCYHYADSLLEHEAAIMAENAQDVETATGKVADALLQRLVLKHNKIQQLAGECGGWMMMLPLHASA